MPVNTVSPGLSPFAAPRLSPGKPPPARRSWLQQLMGDEPRQRMRLSQSLLALAVYVLLAVVQQTEMLLGMIDAADLWPLLVFTLGGSLGFVGLIRSGLNRQFRSDPAMTFAQCLWALVGMAWAYAITGAARGAVLLVLVLVLVFGLFALTPRQARLLAASALALLGGVMLWKTHWSAVRYAPEVEAMHLVFAGTVLTAVSTLSIRFGRMRTQLVAQRSELTQALHRIQALATHDQLTGLINRRAVLERLHSVLALRQRAAQSQPHSQPQPQPVLSLALIDIDHFKAVNDNHGHAAGDTVLRRFADCAADQVRTGDLLARWGGEEFLLVLPATSAAEALQGLARLRERLQAQQFDDVAPGLQLSFSAGVAECSGEADMTAAIDRADRAMYRAKNAGRDRALGP